MNKELEWTIFIVALVVASLFYFAWVLYGPIKRRFYASHTVKAYYHKIRQVALDMDLYLVNAFHNKTAGTEDFHIDHIIVGDKFIYVIADRYYPGTILGQSEDERWQFYQGKKTLDIPNPMTLNRVRAERLSLLTPIDDGMIVPIVVVNDDCFYSPMEQNDHVGYIIALCQLERFIEKKEAQDIDPIEPDMARFLANDLHNINLNEDKK